MRIQSKRGFLQARSGTNREEESDEALADMMARGDNAALEALYDRHAPTVLGIALRILGDRPAAEDVLQEAFWRAWRSAATYQALRGSFTSWLFRIARNLAIDVYRRRQVRPRAVTDVEDGTSRIDTVADPNADVLEQSQALLRHGQVRKALNILPPDQRTVLELAYFYGMTRQEIAKATGEPLGTIHTRARLGLQKLREELRNQDLEE